MTQASDNKVEIEAKASPVFAYRCPECHAPLTLNSEELACAGVTLTPTLPLEGGGGPHPALPHLGVGRHRFQQKDGIWPLLSVQARQRLARFLRAYTKVREAEGWARPEPDSDLGANAAYYLALPDYDLSGLYNATWKMRGRNYREMVARLTRQYPGSLRILDLGAGNCWMSRRLAEAGHQVCAVDINMHPADGLPVARVYFARLPVRFARVEGEMANLPLADAQFDAVIANASLHYAADLDAALREAARVLRPGGTLVTLDSPFYGSAAAGEQMLAGLKAAYARYHLPAASAGGFFTAASFSDALAAAGLGRIEWQGSWRRGALNFTALRRGLADLLRGGGRESASFPLVFAHKDGGA